VVARGTHTPRRHNRTLDRSDAQVLSITLAPPTAWRTTGSEDDRRSWTEINQQVSEMTKP
jgi:hypothetical protein